MKKYLLLIAVSLQLYTSLSAAKIVVIGAGPVGLATAIEAAINGHNVTVIEKREQYTRKQTIILNQESLALLEKWQVSLTACHRIDSIGMIVIKDLEYALKERLQALGFTPILGTYDGISNKQAHVTLQDSKKVHIPYDLLVGADGTYSLVRQHANIPLMQHGKAFGKIAFVQEYLDASDPFTITDLDGLFIMKIPIPSKNATVFCMQAIKQDAAIPSNIQQLSPLYSEWFELPLQQASRFYNKEKSIILVGDAAATASYLKGRGLNTGFLTAHLAGQFLPLQEYDDEVQKVTDRLIEESRPLY